MPFRFTRRINLLPGVDLNLSKKGASISIGPKGAKFTIGTRGVRGTVGVPGTGFYYTKEKRWGTGKSSEEAKGKSSKELANEEKLSLSYLDRVKAPKDEENFVDGLKAFLNNEEEKALKYFTKSLNISDSAFMAGFIALKNNKLKDAQKAFDECIKNKKKLGQYFEKYDVDLNLSLEITDELDAFITPSYHGLLLGIIEVNQLLKEYDKAIEILDSLKKEFPDDIVAKLSLAEILLEVYPNDEKHLSTILDMSKGIANDTPVHTALLLYIARAQRALGKLEEANKTLSAALRKKKDRTDELLGSLRYEKILVFKQKGDKSSFDKELKKLKESFPDFELEESLKM